MSAAATPAADKVAAEAERLRQLRDLFVLDSAAEPVFDSLVRLASEVCGVPIALLSLVDGERQWFKANIGLPGVSETPRDVAFCSHAIDGEDLFEIGDTTADARFAANPLVTGDPSIRFYAGMPLQLPGGARVGTLCVIDREPRQLDAAQAATLRSLAIVACEALVMRRDLITRALSIRSQHEIALAESEARHRMLVEHQPDLASLAEPDGTLVYVNAAYARYFGRTAAEMIGASLYDFCHPADRETLRLRLATLLADGGSLAHENRMRGADGADGGWVAWANSIQADENGRPLLRSVGRDVTEKKRAEAALRASQAFLFRTGRVAGVGGWEVELPGGAITWSQETRRIHGVDDDYVPNLETAINFYAPEGRPLIEAAVRAGIERGEGWDLELPFISASGRAMWVRAVGEVEFDAGVPARLVGAFQDITARKQLEARLADSDRFVRGITNSLPLRIAYVDAERRFRFVNDAHCRRFGRSREAILGRTRSELMNGVGDEIVEPRIRAVLAGERQSYEYEDVIGGELRCIETQLIPDVDATGTVRGFFTSGIDITDRRRDEQRTVALRTEYEHFLEEARRKAEDANRAKSEFLANMSHEIRTPLHAVLGLSQLLGQTSLDESQASLLAKMNVAGKSLLAVINDVLDLSKVEAGGLQLEDVDFDLRGVFADLADVHGNAAAAKGLAFAIDVPHDLPTVVRGDATRLAQVFNNLLSNAIKFTDRGRVGLRVEASPRSGGRLACRFEVSDTGIGIDATAGATLFSPFVQADASTTRRFGGTGLGLSIVKRLVALMGGRVDFESVPGVGTVFRVDLEFAVDADADADADIAAQVPRETPERPDPSRSLDGIRVLLVDDSDINLEVGRGMLVGAGAAVACARDGAEAVARIEREPGAFDIVLMDLQMPVLDGAEATRRLRLDPAAAALPVLAVSAGVFGSDRERASAAGVNGFVAKPFDAATLTRAILQHVRPPSRQLAVQLAARAAAPDLPPPLPPWPEIDGIDGHDARVRLGGDQAMFRGMLKRLFEEFAQPQVNGASDAGPGEAARQHKLRGSAGMLGARSVQQLAGEAEAACRGGDAELARALRHRIATEIAALRRAARPFLEASSLPAAAQAGAAAPASAPAEAAQVEALVALLREQSLAALDRFAVLAPGLRAWAGPSTFAAIGDDVDNLRFAAAADALERRLAVPAN